MNDIEERLRAALHARAQTYDISPGAWHEVRRRTERGARGRLWLPAALAVALAAILVAPAVSRIDPPKPDAAADPVIDQLMTGTSPLGGSVTLDDPAGVELWFARGPRGEVELCFRIDRPRSGGCRITAGFELSSQQALYAGTTEVTGAEEFVDYGVYRGEPATVTAVTRDGSVVEGRMEQPEGAPLPIWSIPLKAADQVGEIRFTGAEGRQVAVLSRAWLPDPPASTDPAVTLTGGILAYRTGEQQDVLFTRRGVPVGRTPLDPVQTPRMVSGEGLLFGVVSGATAHVTVAFRDGRKGVDTVPDPWGLGLALFAVPGGETAMTSWAGHDASGAELWRVRTEGDEEYFTRWRIGEPVTVAGSEGAGPLRLWWADVPGQGRQVCGSLGCLPSSQDGLGPSGARITTYPPEGAEVTRYGAAGESWTSVTAVAADGRRFPGTFERPPGATYRIWFLRFPREARIAAIAVGHRDGTAERLHTQ
ncbi:hypothetical protein ACIBH1_35025 [Nonomuraea sp. NPDC050663]|uniref:hypothetical protein n=1 Tax=Nonomuraea sp. NPDC050663 TaxID=3364370 RepID=UPI0037A4690D